jgi:hypothetical protein
LVSAPQELVTALQGRYVFEHELGSGGMATVYLARDLQNDRPVAIKVLRADIAAVFGAERFAREIRISSGLQHPNILPVLDSGHAGGIPFYVTTYIHGESLAQRLHREHQLSIDDALQITTEVCDALAAAHAKGYVHRDVKPSNILLENGRAILSDFGIARAADVVTAERLTETGIALGTPAYMSPEQSDCGTVDGRSDVYSLGCVLFEMLAGSPPFTGASAQSLRARHAADPPPPLHTVRTTVPPSMESVIDKALAKVPADRFHTALEFAEALASSNHPVSAWHRLPWLRIAALAGLVLVTVLGIWARSGSSGGTLDANKVVVFPLVQRGGSIQHAGLGEEVALLIGSALEHSEPLRWIDGWTWLDLKRRADVQLLDARTARNITRARRARFYIDGAVLGSGDSSTVILRLNDAGGDSLLAQTSASGRGAEAVASLGLTAISKLLPRLLAPGRQVDFAPLSERRPAAIAMWLQGEREYRQSQFLRAFDYYGRAVKEDSALALAAVKGAQAADWMGYGADARGFVTAALRHEDKLPPKYAQLAHGLQSFLTGRADSAIARYRMALQLDPAWSEAWMALGDVYFHLLPNESPLDSLALRAFTEARRADPEFIPPLFHIVEMSLRGPDLARADTLLAEFRRFNPDSTWTLQLGLMAACRKQGPGSSAWATAGSKHGDELFYAAKALAATGAHWGCSEAGLRQLIGSDSVAINYRRAALLILQSVLVAQGRYEGAARLIDSAAARGMPAAKNLYLVDAAAGAPFDQKVPAVLDGLVEGTKTLEGPKLWFQGSWYAHTRDAARLTRVVEQLQDKVRSTADPLDSLLAESMTARLDLVRGDTLSAKNRLLALQPCATLTYITWGLWQSLAPERMALAEILLAQNEPARAIEVASGFDQIEPAVYILYWPRSLALRYRAAAKLGRTDLAERYAARLREIGRTDLLQVQVSSEQTPTRREP